MVKITRLQEAGAKLREICGEDCPSHVLYHIEMSMEAFLELVADPRRFAARYRLPLCEGNVHISYLVRSAAERPAASSESTETEDPAVRTVSCSYMARTNTFACST